MSMNIDLLTQDALNSIKEKISNLKVLNIVVAGKTGVGKSTLINAVFREKLAETGVGKPVTTHMRKLTKKDVPLRIYDTRGFELGADVQDQVKKEVLDTIQQGLAKNDINEAIHCIWYCINAASNRIEQEEIEWLRELTQENLVTEVPIIVVLTQAISAKTAAALKQVLLDENLDIVQIVPVLAEDFEVDDEYVKKSFGLDVLIKVMGEALPDELMDTLQNLQIVALEEKKKHAQAFVVTAAAAAAAEAVVPIPFASAALLIPTQIGMIASITAVFGFNVNKSIIAALLSSTIGAGGATLIGRTVVGNVIKLIPGAGTIAGGVISAAAASVLTIALGETYIMVMELIFKGEMNLEQIISDEGKHMMQEAFKQGLMHGI